MGNKGMPTFKNKPLLAIIAIGVATALAAVVFSVQSAAHALEAFGGSGYVLQVEAPGAEDASGQDAAAGEDAAPLVTPAAFTADASYRYRYPDTVQFTDSEGVKTSVSQNSFIHYDDASVAAFVKTVFVDLDHVADPVVYYYDLPAGRTMEFDGASWRLDNGGSELTFSHVLLKLDEAHYLVLSNDITFSVNGETQMNFKGAGSYLEVEYIEGGIVRFSNDQGSYQTIANDATVSVGNGVQVNFGNKLVSNADGAKLSLDQMVIDADDNIEISPEAAEALAGGADGEDGAEGAGVEGGAAGAGAEGAGDSTTTIVGGGASASGGAGGSSSSGSMAGGVLPGGDGQANGQTNGQANGQDGGSQNNQDDQGGGSQAGDDTEGDGEEGGDVLEDTNDSRKTPSFSISEGSTSPVGFEANISITDEENMLSSGTTVTIVDRLTGKVVYESNVAAGVLDFDISAAGLDPDKEYVLSATATYRDGDQEYTKSFLDKVFKTDPVGIMMNKSYAAVDALGINVQVGAYANVVNAKLRLLDAEGNQVEMRDIDVEGARGEGGVDIAFENLNSNSVYAAELREVTYSNVTVESFGDALALKTLRKAPSLPAPVSTPDRKAMQFALELPADRIVDPDAGITGYTWEVYKAEDVDATSGGAPMFRGDPVWTARPAEGTKVNLPVDNIKILNGGRYVARVLVSFDDNEKVITFDTPFTTPPFGMDGVAFPTVRLEEANDPDKYPDGPITFESYHGMLYIDNAAAIVNGSEIKVVYRDEIGNEADVITSNVTDNSTGTIAIPLDLNNLRQNATYTVQVFATYNLGDGNPNTTGYIGAARFNTPKADTIQGAWEPNTDSSVPFSVSLNLKQVDAEHNIELEMKTMSTLKISLYEGSEGSGVLIADHTFTGGTSKENPYGSTLYDSMYKGAQVVTPATFGISNDLIKPGQEYTLTLGPATDYTLNKNEAGKDVPNDLPLTGISYGITTSKTWPPIPADSKDGVRVDAITNEVAEKFGGEQDSNLDSSTVVGYRLRSTFNNGNKIAQQVTYYVIDADEDKVLAKHSVDVLSDTDVPEWTFFFGKEDGRGLTRGRRYRFAYTMTIKLEENVQEILTYPACVKKGDATYADPANPLFPLSSKMCEAPNQLAKFSVLLEGRQAAQNGADQAVWKWTAYDYDDVLDSKKTGNAKAFFKYAIGNGGFKNAPLEMGEKPSWNEYVATVESGKTYTLKAVQNPYVYGKSTDLVETPLFTHYIDAKRSWTVGENDPDSTEDALHNFTAVTHGLSTNTGVLNIDVRAGSQMTHEDLCAVAALEVELKGKGKSKTLYVAPEIVGGAGGYTLHASIALSSISDLLGSELDLSARVVYDSGDFGLKDEDGLLKKDALIAFQELSGGVMMRGDYVKVPAGSSYTYETSAELRGGGSILAADMPEFDAATAFASNSGNAQDIPLTVLGSPAASKVKVATSEGGLVLMAANGVPNGAAVAVKHLAVTDTALKADAPVVFDAIPPIAHVTAINPGIDRGQVTFTPELVGMTAKGGTLFVTLEEKKQGESAYAPAGTFEYPGVFVDGKQTTIDIPKGIMDTPELGLTPTSQYRFKLSVDAYVSAQSSDKAKRMDVIDKSEGEVLWYDLRLYDTVVVDVTDMSIIPDADEPYGKKTLEVRYTLEDKLGFTTSVEIFALDENGQPTGDPLLTETKEINADKDTFVFDFNPGSKAADIITLGKRYQVRVACYTVDKGEGTSQMLLGEDTMTVMLDTLDAPTTSITARPQYTEVPDEEQRKINEAARAAEKARAEQLAAEAAAALEREVAQKAAAEQAAKQEKQQAADQNQDAGGTDVAGDAPVDPLAGAGVATPADAMPADNSQVIASSSIEVPAVDAAAVAAVQGDTADADVPLIKKYGIEFNVSVFDLEGSLVGGEYKVRFFDGRNDLPTQYDDQVFNIKQRNKSFVLEDLKPNTTYSIEVYGVLDQGNTGDVDGIGTVPDAQLIDNIIASSTGKTTPSSGVEVGIVQLSQRAEHPNQFTMSFYGSLNLNSVDSVKYTIYSPNLVVKNETVDFALNQAGPEDSPYYTFNPGVDLPEAGLYTVQMTYLGADGKTLAQGTYEYVLPHVTKGR